MSFSIPAEKICSIDSVHKTQRFATHCVDHEVALNTGLQTSYAFDSEEAYYDDLRISRYAVTTKRGGWDCLRHYEIAAAGALPCFRQLDTKPASCAPHSLKPGVNCVDYTNWSDLEQQVAALDANPIQYQELLQASRDWIFKYTTTAASKRLLDLVYPK